MTTFGMNQPATVNLIKLSSSGLSFAVRYKGSSGAPAWAKVKVAGFDKYDEEDVTYAIVYLPDKATFEYVIFDYKGQQADINFTAGDPTDGGVIFAWFRHDGRKYNVVDTPTSPPEDEVLRRMVYHKSAPAVVLNERGNMRFDGMICIELWQERQKNQEVLALGLVQKERPDDNPRRLEVQPENRVAFVKQNVGLPGQWYCTLKSGTELELRDMATFEHHGLEQNQIIKVQSSRSANDLNPIWNRRGSTRIGSWSYGEATRNFCEPVGILNRKQFKHNLQIFLEDAL